VKHEHDDGQAWGDAEMRRVGHLKRCEDEVCLVRASSQHVHPQRDAERGDGGELLVHDLRDVELLLAVVRHELIEPEDVCQQHPPLLATAKLPPDFGYQPFRDVHLARL